MDTLRSRRVRADMSEGCGGWGVSINVMEEEHYVKGTHKHRELG